MPSRRRRLATLRVLGSRPQHATDESNEHGMDASTSPPDADRDAGRSRSAPTFCKPKQVPAQPFRDEDALPVPAASLRRGERPASHITVETNAMSRAQVVPSPRARDNARSSVQETWNSVRPLWEDEPLMQDAASPSEPTTSTGPAWAAVARGVGLLFGTLIVVDLFAPTSHFTGSLWWLDLWPLPVQVATGFLGTCAAVLIAFAARAALPKPIRFVAGGCVLLMILIALKDAVLYYGLLKRGDLHAGPPIAFSLHIVACLTAVLLGLRGSPAMPGPRDILCVLLGFNGALLSLPIAQIACVGPIDGRRSAEAAVVFGPRPFEPSDRLAGRIRTAMALHEQGLVSKLILVGSSTDEARTVASQPEAKGAIDPEDIVCLSSGDDVEAFRELRSLFPADDGREPVFLAVSDADHLPRLQIEARRAGVKIATVPAGGAPPSRAVIVRETFELWRRYFRR